MKKLVLAGSGVFGVIGGVVAALIAIAFASPLSRGFELVSDRD
jgi:hypothetical protein